jgi:hypothetical protein
VKCDEIRKLLEAFGDASLPEPGRIDVSRHLKSCAACRGTVERRRRLGSLLRAAFPVPDPGDAHFERERARILGAAGAAARRSRLTFLVAGALAAAAVVMVVAGPAILKAARRGETVPHEPVARSEASPRIPEPAPPRSLAQDQAPSPSSVPSPRPEVASDRPAAAKAGPPAGTAERMGRMTKEAVEVALAETPSERVAALCAAAEAQLRELPEAMVKDPALAAELAGAYSVLVGEGVAGVLQDKEEPEAELAAARALAARRARDHETALAALTSGTRGSLKESLVEALAASRSVSGR